MKSNAAAANPCSQRFLASFLVRNISLVEENCPGLLARLKRFDEAIA
jgi:hypothetical protein